jgi:hypothetical protein
MKTTYGRETKTLTFEITPEEQNEINLANLPNGSNRGKNMLSEMKCQYDMHTLEHGNITAEVRISSANDQEHLHRHE